MWVPKNIRNISRKQTNFKILIISATKQSLDLSLAVAEAGADAILLQTPHYFSSRMTVYKPQLFADLSEIAFYSALFYSKAVSFNISQR